MKKRAKKPFIPAETHDTTRKELVSRLLDGPCSARDLSATVGIPEREVSNHLEHIRKSISATGLRLVIMPAECKKCGFVFAKRDKLKRPGKCPVCKGESIREPLYAIEGRV